MAYYLPIVSLFSVLFINTEVICSDFPAGFLARPLLPGKVYQCCKHEPYISRRDVPVVYCYYATPKLLLNTWQSVSASIDLSPDQYEVFEGSDIHDVWEQFEAHRSSWSLFNLMNFRGKETVLNPFNNTCLGIRTTQDYSIKLRVTEVDYLRVTAFVVGVSLFLLSRVLSSNQFFYYLTGITVGVSASILILVYFFIKLLPLKRTTMFGLMAGGSTLAFYFFQTFYEMVLPLALQYQEYVIGYLLLSALISFIVCYRLGPVSNPRSKNLIKWSLQVFALIMIFMSSYLREVTLAADVILVFMYNIPVFKWIASFGRLSKRLLFRSKPHQRLLTRDEFREQAEVETKRNLEQLRAYCNSPECRHWQTVLRLRNPHRFAKFMEGKSHLSKEEVEQYEEEGKRMMDSMLTDDSESDED